MKRAAYLIAAAFTAALSLSAQEGVSPLAVQVGAGFVMGAGRTGSNLNTGWNMSMGGGYNFNSIVGALIDFNTNDLGVNSTTFNAIGVPGGHVVVFSATLDPIVHLIRGRRSDIYVTGGGGWFRRGFDPAGESFAGINDYSVNKPGVDVGVGIAFGSRWNGKFYAEARYNHIYDSVNSLYTNFMPVTFGYRW